MCCEGNFKVFELKLEGEYKLVVEKCEIFLGDKCLVCKDEVKCKYKFWCIDEFG